MEQREVEEALFRAFITPHRRHRYLTLLESRNGRRRLRQYLPHNHDLDMRFAQSIPPSQTTPAGVHALLRKLGAPDDCFIVSEDPDLDGNQMPLLSALEHIIGQGQATLLSCVPGSLAYYQGEHSSECVVLRRTR